MKTLFLLAFSFTIAFASVARAEEQDQDKVKAAPKHRPQAAQNSPQVAPPVAPPRKVISQMPQSKRNLPPTPPSPKVNRWQPTPQPPVSQPAATVKSNTRVQNNDWQNRVRAPRTTAAVETDANNNWRRNNQNVTGNWRNRVSTNNSWEEACRRNHRQHHYRNWWRSHYSRFALFGSGYYFWDGGYWYPAYGYDPAYNSYSYDQPIYGYNDLDPAQVIANVQTELQRLGYYRYAVDGWMGPMTRAAIADFQRDNGLAITAAIDEPTLQSLGLG